MKNLILLFSFISAIITAQNNRFIYEYKYVPNIHEKDTIKKGIMFLDITEKGSKYYSHEKFVQDSTTKAEIEKQISMGGGNINIKKRSGSSEISYSVEKTYPAYTVSLLENISNQSYKISEDEIPVWTILKETEKIGEYQTQKATCSFGGRNWTAWFSKELPFQDGPYKFYGLPGLIVKIEDDTKTHLMTLVANKKLNTSKDKNDIKTNEIVSSISILGLGGGKPIDINEKQFKKLRQEYLMDPAKSFKQMQNSISGNTSVNTSMKMMTPDGREISDMNEIYKKIEKRVKDSEEKFNNRIEPSLYSK